MFSRLLTQCTEYFDLRCRLLEGLTGKTASVNMITNYQLYEYVTLFLLNVDPEVSSSKIKAIVFDMQLLGFFY